MRRMEAAISSTRAEVCELMKTTSKSYKKMDTLEKDVKSLKDTVDQLQKLVKYNMIEKKVQSVDFSFLISQKNCLFVCVGNNFNLLQGD